MKFRIKHFGNLVVRLFTKDKYYVCEGCHKIHKRDGKEHRFDRCRDHLMYNYLWYGSIKIDCFEKLRCCLYELERRIDSEVY